MERTRLLTVSLVLVGIFAAVSFGAAIYFFQDREALWGQLNSQEYQLPSSTPIPLPTPDFTSGLRATGDSEEVQGLNAYIDKLEKENAAYKQQLAQLAQDNSRNSRNDRGNRRNGPPNMEELKESDPEAYERFQQMRQRMEQRMQEQREKRDTYFASLDTARLSGEQQTTIRDYQSLLEEMEEAMRNPGENGGQDMRELGREMMEMRGEVQEILFQELGSRLGADGEAISEGVQEIMSVMGNAGPGFGGPGGPGPGGPGR